MTRLLLPAVLALAAGLFPACTRPCESPILYRLGSVDSRFGISERELLSVLRRAEGVWEDASRRDLFRHSPDAELVVNLVYDDRQRTAQENARRANLIDKAAGWADDTRATYEKAKARYEAARRRFEAAQAAHQARVDAFNRSVQAWNSRGGAPPNRLRDLQREEAAIRAADDGLERDRLEVNALASRANSLSERYNDLVGEVNANVEAVNTTAGREFKQGRYVTALSGKRIDVFEYVDRIDLIHVLAHEMGHALGLLHNDNPASIMFGSNSSQFLVPSPEDQAALREVCGFE